MNLKNITVNNIKASCKTVLRDAVTATVDTVSVLLAAVATGCVAGVFLAVTGCVAVKLFVAGLAL